VGILEENIAKLNEQIEKAKKEIARKQAVAIQQKELNIRIHQDGRSLSDLEMQALTHHKPIEETKEETAKRLAHEQVNAGIKKQMQRSKNTSDKFLVKVGIFKPVPENNKAKTESEEVKTLRNEIAEMKLKLELEIKQDKLEALQKKGSE
jgi:hypothetical protein